MIRPSRSFLRGALRLLRALLRLALGPSKPAPKVPAEHLAIIGVLGDKGPMPARLLLKEVRGTLPDSQKAGRALADLVVKRQVGSFVPKGWMARTYRLTGLGWAVLERERRQPQGSKP